MNRAWRALTDSRLSREQLLDGFLALSLPGPRGTQSVGEVFGRDHPYVREMVACLASHDGDFLDAVLLRFDETYRRLDDDLLAALDVPIVVLRADGAAGGLLTDDDVHHVQELAKRVVVQQVLPGRAQDGT